MLHENLLTLRKLHQLSQEAVAEQVGVSRQALAKWESGETIPDIEKCTRLAQLYGVSLDDLVSYSSRREGGLPIPPKGKYIFGAVTVGEKGQIVIPKRARTVFDLHPGDQLIVLGDEQQGIALIRAEDMLHMVQEVQRAMQQGGDDA